MIKIKLAVAVLMARNFDSRIVLSLMLGTIGSAWNNLAPVHRSTKRVFAIENFGNTGAPEAAIDQPRVLPRPCPCCGGRMIVIETFERGCEPKHRPTPAPAAIGIDTS